MKYAKYRCELCNKASDDIVGAGKDFEYLSLAESFSFSICRACSHMFLTCRPEKSQVKQIYPRTYYTVNSRSPLYLKGLAYSRKIRMDAARISRFIREKSLSSVLDVGCGDCARLIYLRQHLNIDGLKLTGIDFQFSSEVVANATGEGIELIQSGVENLPVSGKKYDLILLTQLLEHLFSPRQTLEKLFNSLNPDGIIIIDTPCWGSIDFKIFKKRYWGAYHFPRHFNIFSPDSLKTFVESCGFKVVKQAFLPSPGFWIVSFRNRLKLNSIRRSNSIFEFINFSCLPVVGAFTLFDKILIGFNKGTSNQYIVAERPR